MRQWLGVFLIALGALVLPAAANAMVENPLLQPTNLRVAGGEGTWHAENDFSLDWDPPAALKVGTAVSAVHYRVRNASGTGSVQEAVLPWRTEELEHLHVPGPGTWIADVWLEGPGGQIGPTASAALRFDDARPAPARPIAPAGWIAGTAPAIVRLEHPHGPQPVSGIRGYAVSVGPAGSSGPCLAPRWCAVSETDLHEGVEGDTISLGVLPEGDHVVRAVAVSGSGMASSEVGTALVHVDATLPTLTLDGPLEGWANGPVQVTVRAGDARSGMLAAGPPGPFVSIAIDAGAPRRQAGDSATATVSGEGAHRIAFYARDAAGNSGERGPQLATVRIDQTPPMAVFAAGRDPEEPERIEALVADSLSGPDPKRGSIALRPAGSRQGFATLPTTVLGNRLLARWDSDAFAPGNYEFRATAFDAAGNVVSSERRQSGGRMVLANPLKTPTSVLAGFGGRRLVWQRCSRVREQRRCRRVATESFGNRPTLRAVPFGRTVVFGGRLATAAGWPLAGQPVEIVETFAAGTNRSRRTTLVRTAADGVFLARLAPGPSRSIEASFAGSRTLTRGESGGVWLDVLAGVRMHASSSSARIGGGPVVFTGRVESLDAAIPRAGRPVELQFRVPGGGWSQFRTVQTDAQGRFRYAYSFSDDDSRGIRFQFRAFAPAEDGWPYEPASSTPVFVTGR
jgi:hypothetical protein